MDTKTKDIKIELYILESLYTLESLYIDIFLNGNHDLKLL